MFRKKGKGESNQAAQARSIQVRRRWQKMKIMKQLHAVNRTRSKCQSADAKEQMFSMLKKQRRKQSSGTSKNQVRKKQKRKEGTGASCTSKKQARKKKNKKKKKKKNKRRRRRRRRRSGRGRRQKKQKKKQMMKQMKKNDDDDEAITRSKSYTQQVGSWQCRKASKLKVGIEGLKLACSQFRKQHVAQLIYLFVFLSVYLPVYLQAWKPSYSARLLHFSKLTTSKTKQFCETSSTFELDNVKNQAILRNFFIFSKLTTSNTKQFCETFSMFELANVKNEASLRDFLIFRSWQHQKRRTRRKLVRKRQAGEGEVRHRNKDERKKLLRREAEA